MRRPLVALVLASGLLVGCGGQVASPTVSTTQAPSPTASVEAQEPVVASDAIQAARAVQSLLERHETAWATSAEAVLAFWSDDVRFTDVLGGWRDAPRATLEQMVRSSLQMWPNLGGGPQTYFVDTTGGVQSSDLWGIGDATEANPVHEVDQYETGDGLLTSLHTTYDIDSLELGAAVVLETNEAQKIVTERVYWELESLLGCGLT